ncbi:MAG: hypothetical protein K0U98_25140 [Deltaproteobacteria bacterium]|nr:hypothetical protein [Deltaproteobacteria bacterium]
MTLELIATCGIGLEEILQRELQDLGFEKIRKLRGAVEFRGLWPDVWRANWWLRTANRVLVRLATWNGHNAEALESGARNLVRRRQHQWAGIDSGKLFQPNLSFVLRATSSASDLTDTRWVALKVKDGLVDGQRNRFGRRSNIDRDNPDLPLRVWLHRNQATLLLDTSGDPLDRRGYRLRTVAAPVREQIAAAAILASKWDGRGPVVDPMCGSGTLLAEAAFIALGRAPGNQRAQWAFQRLPGFDPSAFATLRQEEHPAPGPDVKLYGIDRVPSAISAAEDNLDRAGLRDISQLQVGDGYQFSPPEQAGLLVVNPAYGERLSEADQQWKRLGDLMKQRYKGWRAVVLAGGESKGKSIGLKPTLRVPFRNGPLDARILIFDLY